MRPRSSLGIGIGMAAAALGAACTSGGAPDDAALQHDAAAADSSVDAAVQRDLAAPAEDLAPAGYPAGPYGHAVGETIAPLAWEGYVDDGARPSTAETYGPTTLDALRRGHRYGMVHVAEFY